jgi:hypothetical protein
MRHDDANLAEPFEVGYLGSVSIAGRQKIPPRIQRPKATALSAYVPARR